MTVSDFETDIFDLEAELSVDPAEAAEADAIDLINRRIYEALAARLIQRKITKTRLAEITGLDKSDISRLLRGNSNITARKLGRLLWALDFDFDIVLEDLQKTRNHSFVCEFKLTCVEQKSDVEQPKNSEAGTQRAPALTAKAAPTQNFRQTSSQPAGKFYSA